MAKVIEQLGGSRFTFIDLFAGIGGMRLGLEAVGGTCVYSCERDRWARQTYEANFGSCEGVDIVDVAQALRVDPDAIPEHDVLAAGFPCQPFSLAGVSKKNSIGKPHGFRDESQGRLFFTVRDIVDIKRPRVIVLENVRNLMSHNGGHTLRWMMRCLRELDYEPQLQLINARPWVPQNRVRLFIVAVERGVQFDFASPTPPAEPYPVLSDILEEHVEPRYTITDRLWAYLPAYAEHHRLKGNGFGYGLADLDGATRTLSARYHKDGAEILIPQEGQNPRRLTPVECRRLMGFPEHFEIVVSNTQAYRQFGNAVVVPVVQQIGQQIVSQLFDNRVARRCNAAMVPPPLAAVV